MQNICSEGNCRLVSLPNQTEKTMKNNFNFKDIGEVQKVRPKKTGP